MNLQIKLDKLLIEIYENKNYNINIEIYKNKNYNII